MKSLIFITLSTILDVFSDNREGRKRGGKILHLSMRVSLLKSQNQYSTILNFCENGSKIMNDDKNNTQGIEGWISYYPVEETIAFRLGLQHLMFNYDDGTNRDGETTIKLQLIFSLGPHKAHLF